jgi:glycosyltransferase involved in cell wall biosynthesis
LERINGPTREFDTAMDQPVKKRRVLFISPWYPSRVYPSLGPFVREHAKAAGRFAEVQVLHLTSDRRIREAEGQQLVDRGRYWELYEEQDCRLSEGLKTHRLWHRKPGIPLAGYLGYLWAVVQGVLAVRRQGFRPDLLHANVYDSVLPTLLAGKWLGLPVVASEHTSAFAEKILGRSELLKARLALGAVSFLLPVSSRLAESIRQSGVLPRRLEVVPNIVDPEVFFPASSDGRVEGGQRLLFAGRLTSDDSKGLGVLLSALALLGDKTQWTLRVVGDGPGRAAYESLAETLGLESRIEFLGHLRPEAVPSVMREADLFVHPSFHETFGCVVLEALACGLPVVASQISPLDDLVVPGCGELFRVGNSADLADKLALALDVQRDGGYSLSRILEHSQRFWPCRVSEQLQRVYAEA